LYYLLARYYDSTIGRFITEDSFAGDENDPMTLNRYIYARDNPERYTDPNGRMFVVETDSGQEIGVDYLYTPAVVETVTVADTERKRSEYYVTDIPASTSETGPGASMATYQNTAFGRNNPYGGGTNNPFLGYQWNTFRWQNPYGTPTGATASKSGFTCSGSADYCYWVEFGGTDPYEKIGAGVVMIFLSVGIVVYSGGAAALAEPPPGVGVYGPSYWMALGAMLVFSGFAQFGCEQAGHCSS